MLYSKTVIAPSLKFSSTRCEFRCSTCETRCSRFAFSNATCGLLLSSTRCEFRCSRFAFSSTTCNFSVVLDVNLDVVDLHSVVLRVVLVVLDVKLDVVHAEFALFGFHT